MNNRSFDNFIKDKLTDHVSAVPGDIWERIQLEKGRKRVAFAWWRQLSILAAFVGLAIVAGWVLTREVGKDEASLGIGEKAKAEVGIKQEAKVPNASVNTSEESSSSSTDNTADEALAAGSGSVTDRPNNDRRETVSEAAEPNPGSAFGRSTILQKKRSYGKNSESSKSRFVLNSVQTEPTAALTDEGYTQFNVRRPLNLLLNPLTRDFSWTPLNAKPLSGHSLAIDCPRNLEDLGAWYVEVFGSPDLVMKKTTANRSSGDTYLRRKDSSETSQLSYTYGFRFSKTLGENFIFKTGLQYSQINEKFVNRSENERRLTTVVTSKVITRNDGSTVVVSDTSSYEQIGYSTRTAYNRFRMIDIPVLLGYEWGNENFTFGVNAGPVLNITSWQEGETLDTNYLPSSFAKSRAVEYKKNVGFGFYGGLNINKSLGSRLSVFAEPYFRYNFSHFTNGNSIVNEKFHTAGMLIGVKYKLTRSKATN